MKVLQSSFLRALVAIIVGVLLIMYREETMKWMTITMGILFFVSGLISCVVYYYEKQRKDDVAAVYDENGKEIGQRAPMFPIVGLGSMILGIILAIMPTDLIIGVTYALAGMLILGAISQLVNLVLARKYWSIPFMFWLFPIITLGVAILVIVHPMEAATLPLKIIGWCLMFYGVVECLNAMMIHIARKRYKAAQEAAVTNGEPIDNAIVVEAEEVTDSELEGKESEKETEEETPEENK